MVRYTVATCNYNMAETVGTTLRSILDQTDDRFEVVCVDGGSTDGSQAVLEELADEYDRLCIDLQDPDPSRRLGADRNRSFEIAEGEYILESFDCDNQYYDIVCDLVSVYHQLESGVDREFLLSAMGVNMAPRELVRRIPYRNLSGAEDRDWFRRLAAADAILWLRRTGPIKEQAGYEKNLRRQINRDLNGKVCDFQVGISPWSALVWALSSGHPYIYEKKRPLPFSVLKRLYDVATIVYTYVISRKRTQYETPAEYRQKGALGREIARRRKTAKELAAELGVELDCSNFTQAGRRAFCR